MHLHISSAQPQLLRALVVGESKQEECQNMEGKQVDPLSYSADADSSVLEEIARLDGLRVRREICRKKRK